MEFFLCCIRSRWHDRMPEHLIKTGQNDLNWEYILQAAIRHKVVPILYHAVNSTCKQAVPDVFLERLRKCYMGNTVRNLIISEKLIKLITLFEKSGIPVIPFKGPVMAQVVYGDVAMRQFADIDILVSSRDAVSAIELLVSQGLRPELALDSKQFAKYIKAKKSIELYDDKSNCAVDLHWEMTGGYSVVPFRFKELDLRKKDVDFMGRNVLSFSPENLLFCICFHGAKESWEKLDHICCVAELVNSGMNIDWNRVLKEAGRKHCEKIVLTGLLLAKQIAGVTLPVLVDQKINNDHRIKIFTEKLCRNLFQDAKMRKTKHRPAWRFSSIHIQVRDTFLDKIRFGSQLLIAPTALEWKLLPLPSFLSFLYYILRPMRLAYEFSRKWI